jgi:voltage-gated potassium channel
MRLLRNRSALLPAAALSGAGPRYDRAKRNILQALGGARPGQHSGGAVEGLLLALILLNIVALILETLPNLGPRARRGFFAFEAFSVAVFSVEYLLRVWSCTASPDYRHPLWGRLRFALTPMALIDLMAILPFYVPAVGLDLRFIRAFRLLRVFRILKLGRYSSALSTLARIVRRRKEELAGAALILLLLLIIASSLIYYAEHDAQPELFSSIPATMWWGIITITTIGYGDMYPVTTAGRCLTAVIAVLGIGMFALPTSILGAAFLEEAQSRPRPAAGRTCRHCGRPLDDDDDGDDDDAPAS